MTQNPEATHTHAHIDTNKHNKSTAYTTLSQRNNSLNIKRVLTN